MKLEGWWLRKNTPFRGGGKGVGVGKRCSGNPAVWVSLKSKKPGLSQPLSPKEVQFLGVVKCLGSEASGKTNFQKTLLMI